MPFGIFGWNIDSCTPFPIPQDGCWLGFRPKLNPSDERVQFGVMRYNTIPFCVFLIGIACHSVTCCMERWPSASPWLRGANVAKCVLACSLPSLGIAQIFVKHIATARHVSYVFLCAVSLMVAVSGMSAPSGKSTIVDYVLVVLIISACSAIGQASLYSQVSTLLVLSHMSGLPLRCFAGGPEVAFQGMPPFNQPRHPYFLILLALTITVALVSCCSWHLYPGYFFPCTKSQDVGQPVDHETEAGRAPSIPMQDAGQPIHSETEARSTLFNAEFMSEAVWGRPILVNQLTETMHIANGMSWDTSSRNGQLVLGHVAMSLDDTDDTDITDSSPGTSVSTITDFPPSPGNLGSSPIDADLDADSDSEYRDALANEGYMASTMNAATRSIASHTSDVTRHTMSATTLSLAQQHANTSITLERIVGRSSISL